MRRRARRSHAPPGSGALGMALFLLSLGVLFVGSVIAFLVIRGRAPVWPPMDAKPLPRLLWLSTALLIASSVTVQLALIAIRAGDQARLRRWLAATTGLATFFLASQAVAWADFFHEASFYRHLYGFTFYMLTGLHAAHVLVGVVALVVVLVRSYLGAYSWAHYPGVRNVTVYWHFLDGVWLVLFGLLQATS